MTHNGIDCFLDRTSSFERSGPSSRTLINLKRLTPGYWTWRLFSFLISKSLDVGDPRLAGLANAPRAAERASPKYVRVKVFHDCNWGAPLVTWEAGLLFGKRELCFYLTSNMSGPVVILYRLVSIHSGSSQTVPQSDVYELLKAGYLGKLATTVRYMETFRPSQPAKRPSKEGICCIN